MSDLDFGTSSDDNGGSDSDFEVSGRRNSKTPRRRSQGGGRGGRATPTTTETTAAKKPRRSTAASSPAANEASQSASSATPGTAKAKAAKKKTAATPSAASAASSSSSSTPRARRDEAEAAITEAISSSPLSSSAGNSLMVGLLSPGGNSAAGPVPPPGYLVELAKSGRAECKRCDNKIAANIIRVGVLFDSEWGLITRWQHLECTVFPSSITNPEQLDGYVELDPTNKELVKKRIEQSRYEVDIDTVPVNPDELVRTCWTTPEDAPEQLTTPLLNYQKEGLGWLVHQEQCGHHGGILADEMGMGKTIQALSMILKHRPDMSDKKLLADWDASDKAHEFNKGKNASRGKTLIVVPTIALIQWQMEIQRFTTEGSLSVAVYHGNTRDAGPDVLCNADIVLTTYKILEIEHRKATAGTKIECTICGRKFYPEKLRIHRKYFCGENAQRTEAQARTEVKSQRRNRAGAVSDSDEESFFDDGESSEDSIARQKRRNKKNVKAQEGTKKTPTKAVKKSSKPLPEKKKSPATKKTAKLNVRGASKGKDINSDSGTEGSEYEPSADGSSSDDVSLACEEDVKKVAKSKPTGKSKAVSKSSPSKKSSPAPKTGGKRKAPDDDDDDEDDATSGSDSDDKSLEEYIKRAIALQGKSKKQDSILHSISWFRIILDEAHLIKDRSTSTAHAAFALVSLNKWCLTGTPLQNRVGELYSLVRFLRCDPHAYYFCKTKNCQCKSLHYRFSQGKCFDCGHSAMTHFCYFNKHILNPIKRCGYVAEGRKAMMKLKDQILDSILLRRTKLDRSDDIMLPTRCVQVRTDDMDEKEADFYGALYTQSKAQFNTYVRSGTVLNNYAHIFDILIRLRQAVDHPYLVIFSSSIKDYAPSNSGITSQLPAPPEVEEACALCHEPPIDVRKSACGHLFCHDCAIDLVENAASSGAKCTCPTCNKPLTLLADSDAAPGMHIEDKLPAFKSRKQSILSKVDLSKFQSSTKLEALMQELHIMFARDPGAKCIVFSQFVNMLDLIEYRLHLGRIGSAKLQGNMTVDVREVELRRFKEDPEVKVMLISLKAGGVALNLTVANHIFLMDPWWNPAAEMQAIDRAHRIGQAKPIFATRFIVKDSIEERILKLQEKKQLVFEGTVGGDAASMARLTVDDMKFLFH